MASIKFTEELKKEYRQLFYSCNIRLEKSKPVESIIKKIIANKGKYEAVGNPLGIPWFFIATVHNMESSLSFSKHLHNGDPLTARTFNIPPGRPKTGNPPFSWEESATDALRYERLHLWNNWTLAGILYKLESYNGWGYRKKHPHVLTPYLWSFSHHYTSGKYISDGRWSESAVSQQCGAAVILRRLAEKNEIKFIDETAPLKPIIYYSNTKIQYAVDLQKFLNLFPGIFLKEDGKPGENTSTAFKKVTGYYLNGDPRI